MAAREGDSVNVYVLGASTSSKTRFPMIIDTHVHTIYSDGRDTVAGLFRLSSSLGIKVLVITDHDSTGAYPAAFEEAARYDMVPMSGVELSTRDEDGHVDVHVVGLKIDTANVRLRRELELLAAARIGARQRLLDNTNSYLAQKFPGWTPVRFEDVRRRVLGTVVGRPHVAAGILESARKQGIAIAEEELFSIFRLPEVMPDREYELNMEECITLIKEAGGIPVLAHPCEYRRPDAVMKKFKKLGGVATEVCKYRYKTKLSSVRFADTLERIVMERQMNRKTIEMARRYGLKVTACSDYHAKAGEPGMDTDEYGIDLSWLLEH